VSVAVARICSLCLYQQREAIHVLVVVVQHIDGVAVHDPVQHSDRVPVSLVILRRSDIENISDFQQRVVVLFVVHSENQVFVVIGIVGNPRTIEAALVAVLHALHCGALAH